MVRFGALRSNLTEFQYLNLRAKVLFKQDFKCLKCGKEFTNANNGDYELHHINGDPNDNWEGNLQILCPGCHSEEDKFRQCSKNFRS